MSLLKIARLGNPIIRSETTSLSRKAIATESTQQLIDNMIDTMRDAHGVGIAAPQLHESVRIIAIEVSPSNPRYPQHEAVPLTVLINPTIEAISDEFVEAWEGCLSVPHLRGRVPRASSLTVSALDRYGQPLKIAANGFLARIIQHEVDHLDGTLFLERMADLSTLTHLKEYDQYWKNSTA